jgi:hypothetical protein
MSDVTTTTTSENNIVLSMGKVTFWIGLLASFFIIASALVATGVWLTRTQTDITSLRVDIGKNALDLEKLRTDTLMSFEKLKQEGSAKSQANAAELKVIDIKYEFILKALDQNNKDHEKIMNALAIKRK